MLRQVNTMIELAPSVIYLVWACGCVVGGVGVYAYMATKPQ